MKAGDIGIGRTAININLNINKVLQKQTKSTKNQEIGDEDQRESSETRHVVLNLDAVIINPRRGEGSSGGDSSKKILMSKDTGFEILGKCQKLFIFKSGEPWHQNYSVRTASDQIIFMGKSDEVYCSNMEWEEKKVYLLNNSERELMEIVFHPEDYSLHSNERSFTISGTSSLPDSNSRSVISPSDLQMGIVKLQETDGIRYITGIFNFIEEIQFTGVSKKDTVKIISHHHSIPVAFIDLRRTTFFDCVDSYMITFTKDISINSKALILTAAICYDIGFIRRAESIKSVLIYAFYLCLLIAAGVFLFFVIRAF